MKLIDLQEGTLDIKDVKKRKIPLEPTERKKAMDAGAVWHHGPNGKETCAIWKSKKANGDIIYGCNTHRLWQYANTLDGAIKKFHDVVKDTA